MYSSPVQNNKNQTDLDVSDKINKSISNQHNLKHLRVIFAPWYTKENPYQVQLANHLMSLGVEMEHTNSRTLSFLSTIQQQQVDIIHLHWLDHFFLLKVGKIKSFLKLFLFVFQLLIIRTTKTKIIWTVHNLKNHRNQHLKLDRIGAILVSRLAHGLIVHSQAAKQELMQKFYLQTDKKIFVIPHGSYIDVYENKIKQTEARECLNLPKSSLVLLFFGLIHPYKGVIELSKAFKQINNEEVFLLIAGKPCNDELNTQLLEEVKDNKKIRFISGLIPNEELQIYMNAADAVVLPYKEFLTSGAVVLAMSFAKACVAPRQGYISEILDENGGFLYNPNCEDGLLTALNTLVEKRDNLHQMGLHNYQLAKQWNWKYIAEKTLNVYYNS